MYNWLLVPLTFGESVIFFVLTAITVVIAQVLMNVIWTAVGGETEHVQREDVAKINLRIDEKPVLVHFKIALISFVEEVIFRLLPVLLVELLGYGLNAKIIVSIHSAAIFGYLHGKSWKVRLITGSSGLIFSVFFLKLGGAQGAHLPALVWVGLLHIVLNLLLVTIRRRNASQH